LAVAKPAVTAAALAARRNTIPRDLAVDKLQLH